MEDNISDLKNLSLMVADDSQINHRIVALSLRDCFARIDNVYDGSQAVEVFLRDRPNVILMDAVMPVMDGCEATRRIREIEKEGSLIKKSLIIAMTASENPDDLDLCKQSGMDAYLGKPFLKQAFLDLLKDLL